MIPAVTMQIDKIPLNQNGKVNRLVLPKPEIQRDIKTGIVAPLNVIERELKNIVAEILGTDKFDITENFNKLGLTSISAIKLATAIYKKYGIQVQVKNLIECGTIQTVENEILQKILTLPNKKESKPVTESKVFTAPLTFSQKGVYLDCLSYPKSTTYNCPFLFKVPESIT